MNRFWKNLTLTCLLATAPQLSLGESEDAPLKAAEGLWEYTDLITKDGQSLPLTGIFLIKEDVFLQQSIFNGEPFAAQGSMAHAGPYWAGGAGLRLRSNQTLSMDPAAESPLSSAGAMEHDLKVIRDGDDLTLIFGGGTSTVQTFRHLGDAENTEIYSFADGNLAFTEGYFILVIGDENTAVSGYGHYTRDGEALTLEAIRWAESDGSSVTNLQNVELSANLSDTRLTLSDGRSFGIVQ